MKILHTADWHLGHNREKMDRLEEQHDVVREIGAIARAERVDLVLLAGDIYDTFNPPAAAERIFFNALDELADEGRRSVVVIAGNHDSPDRLSAVRPLAERLGIALLGGPKECLSVAAASGPGRVARVAAGPSWLEIDVPGCSHRAVIGALPFPSEARLQEVLSPTPEELDLQRAYHNRVRQLLADVADNFRADTVNLLMSHLFVVGGAESDSERNVQLGGAYAVYPDAFPREAHYVALGHLHRPQFVEGAPVLTRYCGSPLALSFSEAGQAKSVTILDIIPGRPVEWREVFLTKGRPLARWVADQGLAQVETWLQQGKDANAWIDLEIHTPTILTMDEIQRLRKLSPRIVNIATPSLVRAGNSGHPGGEKLPIDEMFRRFYAKSHGSTPEEPLVRLFMELAAPEESLTPSTADPVPDEPLYQ